MKISGQAWNLALLRKMPIPLGEDLKRGWRFNPKQAVSKSRYGAKKRKKK